MKFSPLVVGNWIIEAECEHISGYGAKSMYSLELVCG
jgi:hypothetical protein